MKAPFTLSSAIDKAVAVLVLVVVIPFIYPHFVAAAGIQNAGENALVFTVEQPNQTDITGTSSTKLASYDEIAQADPLVIKLQTYLESHNSPLAQYASEIVQQPQWQRALAISYQESHFGLYCYEENCSGIGGAPGRATWRKYPDKLAWFKDMAALMEKPIYKERFTDCAKMNGVYNAGSSTWKYSCEQKSEELLALTRDAEQERYAMANGGNTIATSVQDVQVAANK